MIAHQRNTRIAALIAGMFLFSGIALGQQADNTERTKAPSSTASPAPAARPTSSPAAEFPDGAAARIEGEKRFATNCGRCHLSPHKFPPRMVMTIERHMRVRATLTDEDMRLIVGFLTQ
jgi:mono/diheme cytochrome c family protein